MKQQISITVPKDWSAVSLRKYLELQEDLKAYADEPEATVAALFYHLCKIQPELMLNLDAETFSKIRKDLFSFIGNVELPLIEKFTHNGKEWGFFPNLAQIEYGAYVDISKFDKLELGEDWPKIMAVLYRPVTKTIGKLYEVETYNPQADWEWFMDLSMDIHFGAYFFFINLSRDLVKGILNYTKTAELPLNIQSVLERSGDIIHQLLPSPETISLK
jgi:hypothetical protein